MLRTNNAGAGRHTHALSLQQHTLLAFFGLTFVRSWSLWGLQSLLVDGNPISARWLGTIAAYGPTLAAIVLAALLHPKRQTAVWSQRRLWLAGAVLVGTVWLNRTLMSWSEQRLCCRMVTLMAAE